mmetsp:Transcript_15667/g.43955  ORF Transcript_15667/g.43955 Transcript_15667/m.43955 type:complete len:214 (-) Transcript_15667:1053-1694(-)
MVLRRRLSWRSGFPRSSWPRRAAWPPGLLCPTRLASSCSFSSGCARSGCKRVWVDHADIRRPSLQLGLEWRWKARSHHHHIQSKYFKWAGIFGTELQLEWSHGRRCTRSASCHTRPLPKRPARTGGADGAVDCYQRGCVIHRLANNQSDNWTDRSASWPRTCPAPARVSRGGTCGSGFLRGTPRSCSLSRGSGLELGEGLKWAARSFKRGGTP